MSNIVKLQDRPYHGCGKLAETFSYTNSQDVVEMAINNFTIIHLVQFISNRINWHMNHDRVAYSKEFLESLSFPLSFTSEDLGMEVTENELEHTFRLMSDFGLDLKFDTTRGDKSLSECATYNIIVSLNEDDVKKVNTFYKAVEDGRN